jgi:hypothetical protein
VTLIPTAMRTSDSHSTCTERNGMAVPLYTCIREISGSNLDWHTVYTDWELSWFFSFPPGRFFDSTSPKAHLHGSPRWISTVESTKVNRVNSSFQRMWSTGLTGEQVGDGQLSFNVVDSLMVTHHRLPVSTSKSRPVPQCRTSRTSFFPHISFF